jgi:hypothetical protein
MGIKLGIRTTVALTHNYLIDDINLRQYTITIIILVTVGILMKHIFEIVKVVGLGLVESPNVEYSTGLLFFDKDMADKEADKLWKEQTIEDERKSGWCGLHFIVKKREVK